MPTPEAPSTKPRQAGTTAATGRRVPFGLLLVILGAAAWYFWPTGKVRPAVNASRDSTARAARASTASSPTPGPWLAPATAASLQADFPLAAPLNAPGSTIARDLEAMRLILEAWRSNFPRDGNPVGENHEIAAALTGDNRFELILIPKNHPALNDRGELCDRWDTPFRFHQLSGDRMEIRSAGPDRKFGTGDDALWSPGGETGLR